MSNLKPCPFCGGTNVGIWHGREFCGRPAYYEAHCYDCHFGLMWESTEQKAIDKWNRRAENENK